jgi:hypothetical protein
MEEKQVKTVKRVIKKLNALRGTLTKSERVVLDALIVREPEVKGHAMTVSAAAAGAHIGAVAASNAAATNAVNAQAAVANAVVALAANGYIVEFH